VNTLRGLYFNLTSNQGCSKTFASGIGNQTVDKQRAKYVLTFGIQKRYLDKSNVIFDYN